jgi:excisionase family DNA binding protein
MATEGRGPKMKTDPLTIRAAGHGLPRLLTPSEVAMQLRTSKKAVYAMVERCQLPGVVRIGRRVLIREDTMIEWLRQRSTPSLRE